MNLPDVQAAGGIVASSHPQTTAAGLHLLRIGGNAVDAAVGAALVEMVVEPERNGLGGYGGCMVIYRSELQEVVSVDYNGAAPLAARPDMYDVTPSIDKNDPNVAEYGVRVRDQANRYGYRAISVPGTVDGLATALTHYGTKSWAEVSAPAIEVAETGVRLIEKTARSIRTNVVHLRQFPATCDLMMPGGRLPKAGELLPMPDVANTLKTLRDDGPRAFYEGTMAATMAEHVQSQGGILAVEDLKQYRAKIRQPLQTNYRGYDIFTPPLSNGGATTLQILNILEAFDIPALVGQTGESSPPADYAHLFLEACKCAWRDRLTHFGDPEFVDVPSDKILSKSYAIELATCIRNRGKIPSASTPSTVHGCTMQLSVVDGDRNMVSLTQTHGNGFGSFVTVPGTGIILNHGMWRFDPNAGKQNSIAPGKRVLNNMSPLLILRQGQPYASLGKPGGRRILTGLAQLVVNLLDFGLTPTAALAVARVHCQTEEPVWLERRASDSLYRDLIDRGHRVEWHDQVGSGGQLIVVDQATQTLRAGVDTRSDAWVQGI